MDKLKSGLKVLEKLNNAGFEAYIVGGAVRDYLLKKELNDIDITTNAKVEDIIKLFDKYDLKAVEYAGITVYYENDSYEITTYRKDLYYVDHRHPKVCYANTLEEDLIRRDFTINGMALDSNLNVVDLFLGKQDLENKLICCIGDAYTRFDEDALRVLRAVYFASKLDFDLDGQIIQVIKENDFLGHLAKEYVKDILEKIIDFDSKKGLEYISQYKILRSFPVYQVLAEEALRYQIKSKDMYSLFYCLHGFLPEGERFLSKDIKKAKEIAKLIRTNFSNISLYESKGVYLDEAKELYKVMYGFDIDVHKLYNELPIHNIMDICFDFSKLNNRGTVQKEIIKEILLLNLENKEEDIMNFIKTRG